MNCWRQLGQPTAQPSMNEEQCLQDVLDIFLKKGHEISFNEPVTHLQHAVQSAQNAQKFGASTEVVLACLLHDIGHICVEASDTNTIVADGLICGIKNHEGVGADYLHSKGFSKRVCSLVEGHSSGKSYLSAKYPDYFELLSADSQSTLMVDQGGLMSPEDQLKYEQEPNFEDNITLRRCDDAAKDPDLPCTEMPLEFIQMMRSHISLAQTTGS